MPKKEFKDFIDDIQTAINKQLIKDEDLERISTSYSLFLIESDLVFFEKNMRRSLTKMRPFSLTAHFTETPIYRRFRHQIVALAFRGFEPHCPPRSVFKKYRFDCTFFCVFLTLIRFGRRLLKIVLFDPAVSGDQFPLSRFVDETV